MSRKFRENAHYDLQVAGDYYLMPFRFHTISAEREVLVNEVGDFLLQPIGTAARVIRREVSKEEDAELYGDLIANFFISEEPIHPLIDVLATRYRTKKAFLDGFTNLHIFVISLRCEHTCHYCQVSRVTENKDAFDMSHANIDAGIELMMRSPSPHVTMEFQGGEALLAYENIVYGVLQAKEKAAALGKGITFVICTNLALISESILAFCKEHDILISSSLDGPDFVHNKNRHKPRANSHQLTHDGIDLSRAVLGKGNVSALMTTTNLSLNYPLEIVDEYFTKGFSSIFLRPISPYGFALRNDGKNKYDTEQFLTFYKRALARVLEYNYQGHFFAEDYATIILKKMLTPFPVGYVDLQSPAGLINNVIVFNYDGKVYASDEARMLAEMGDFTFHVGDLQTSSYEDIFYGTKAQEIAQIWANESLPGCSECAFQSYCGADPVQNHATQGDMVGYRPTSPYCQRNMEIIRYLFELMETDARATAVFHNWVSQK